MSVPFGWLIDSEFNKVTLNFASKDLSLVWVFLLVLLALYFFWTSLERIKSPLKKIFFISLRLLVFLLLLFVLLEPELEFKKSHILRNSIAILVDDTKSMSIKTFPSETQRVDLVRQALKKNSDKLFIVDNNNTSLRNKLRPVPTNWTF